MDKCINRKSELCKARDWQSEWYSRWCKELNEPARFHRKQWEYAYHYAGFVGTGMYWKR